MNPKAWLPVMVGASVLLALTLPLPGADGGPPPVSIDPSPVETITATPDSVSGEYNGLILPGPLGFQERGGAFTLKVNSRQEVSGTVTLGGKQYKTSGANGWARASLVVKDRRNAEHGYVPEFKVPFFTLEYVIEGGRLNGLLSSAESWSSEMTGDRLYFNSKTFPAPAAGTYTVVFPGADGFVAPAGAGFASVNVVTSGKVAVSGSLADGTSFSRNTKLTLDGRVPLYSSLYSKRGALWGWLRLQPSLDPDETGPVWWTRPPIGSPAIWADGFENVMGTLMSEYVAPANGEAPVRFTKGMAVFSSAHLIVPMTNTFTIQDGRGTSTGTNHLSLTFVSGKGFFNGGFVDPASGRNLSFRGVVLQNRDCGYGYFLNAHKESGLVYIGAEQ
jgi:hypothetical protein